MKRPTFAVILLCFTAATGPALADERPPALTVQTVQAGEYVDRTAVTGDRVITFTTDGLEGGGASMFGFSLRRAPGVVRLGLIRPRVNFVAELLKSVENL